MIITEIVKGRNIAIRKPEKKIPCPVEGCPNSGRMGYYQVVGITNDGIKAIRLVLCFCRDHFKEWEKS